MFSLVALASLHALAGSPPEPTKMLALARPEAPKKTPALPGKQPAADPPAVATPATPARQAVAYQITRPQPRPVELIAKATKSPTAAPAKIESLPAAYPLEKNSSAAEHLNLFQRTGKQLREEIRANLHADLHVGFGQIFTGEYLAAETPLSSRVQEPGRFYLKASFQF